MIFKSPHPDITVPDRSLTELLLERIELFGDKTALVDGPSGRSYTYAQLGAAIDRVAASLARRGFEPGDVMAVYSPNLPEYAIALHGVSRLGGVSTTVNPLYTVEELSFQLEDAGAKYLITAPPFLDKARAAAGAVGTVREIFVFGEAEGATRFGDLVEGEGGAPAAAIDPREDLVYLPYSSGTTGVPKGVMLTHRNVVANLVQLEGLDSEISITEQDTLVGVLPFFHIYGLVLIMNYSLIRGATIVTLPRFDLEQFLGILQDHAVTAAHLVPPIVLAMAKHPVVEDYDLSRLRVTLSGAAPLGEALSRAFTARLGVPVLQGYGLTEASPVTHVSLDSSDTAHTRSSGPAIPSTEVKILDVESGEECGRDTDGEVCIRGPQVMKGYLNQPEATAATVDAGGWLHTGDIGYVDGAGYLYLVDRLKELIKYKGYQVAPAELEALLLSHPAIGDAAVIPSPDEEAGEVPKAFVVRKEEVSAGAIMAFVAERVAPHKKIRRLEFVDEIPKAASGKILRRVLVERERAGA